MEMLKTGILFGIGFSLGTGAVAIAINVTLMLVGMALR